MRIRSQCAGRICIWYGAVQVVAFCAKQARSSSTDKREAACACMAEVALKIDTSAVQPHVGPMLRCLLGSFRDSSWPVSPLPLSLPPTSGEAGVGRSGHCQATGRAGLVYQAIDTLALDANLEMAVC
jgi:hypothetical protein